MGGGDRLQEGIRLHTTRSYLEILEKPFGQRTAHLLTEKLYFDQRATVLTDVESDEFSIARGTKPGDPLSSLFFNSVLQSAMEKDTETWKDKALASSLKQLEKCLRISKKYGSTWS